MHNYDSVLKLLLADSEDTLFKRITRARRGEWLNVELPTVNQLRVDLLFATAGRRRRLIECELQSRNDPEMPLRMAYYALAIYQRFGQFPEQYVLYVGNEPLRMPAELRGKKFVCRYTVINISTISAESLLASGSDSDAVLAILGASAGRRQVIRHILQRIAKMEDKVRADALMKLTILAGLRKLGEEVKQELRGMPILDDILDHDLLGPVMREGMEQGRTTEAYSLIRQQLIVRFGSLSEAKEEKLSKLSLKELEELSIRFVQATGIDELL